MMRNIQNTKSGESSGELGAEGIPLYQVTVIPSTANRFTDPGCHREPHRYTEPERQSNPERHSAPDQGAGPDTRAKSDRCNLCPHKCYTRQWVVINSVFTCLGLFFSAAILIGIMSVSGRPHLATLGFVTGTCTTVNATWTGHREACHCKYCKATYPCFVLTVEYTSQDGKVITSMMHDDEQTFTYVPQCSYEPKMCTENRYGDLYARMYEVKWGVPGKTFPCLHNPNGQGAVRHSTRRTSHIMVLFLVPAAFVVITAVLYGVVYCYCCPRYHSERRRIPLPPPTFPTYPTIDYTLSDPEDCTRRYAA